MIVPASKPTTISDVNKLMNGYLESCNENQVIILKNEYLKYINKSSDMHSLSQLFIPVSADNETMINIRFASEVK